MKKNSLIYCFLCLLFLGCSLFSKKEKKVSHIQYPPELKKVNAMVIEKKFDDARILIDDYLNQASNIHWFGHAYYLKAFVFESNNQPDQAVKFYRQAIQHASRYDSLVEAKAIYNLSYVYERTGQMSELSSTLVDLMQRPQHFDVLTAHVETPARLAASFASLGQMKKAKKFHSMASKNYDRMIRHNLFRASREDLSQALYYLGLNVYPTSTEDFSNLNTKTALGQRYLLASAEASVSSWSKKATKQLLSSYENLWALIKKHESKEKLDKMARRKDTQNTQLDMAADFYDLLHRIKAEEFPMSKVNRNSKQIIESANKWLVKVEGFAQGLDLGPETVRTKKVKQRKLYKVIDPELEKKVLEYQNKVKNRDPNSAIAH